MADKVELKADPAVAPPSTIEAKTQPDKGNTTSTTVDTTQKTAEPAKAPAPGDRPAWLPEEFKTAEEFAEAWKAKAPKPPPPPAADPEKAATEAVQKAGLDMGALSEEWSKNQGKLSEETLTKLEKTGVTRAQVDEYITGQQAKAELRNQRLAESVGGNDELQATLKWASSLPQAEIDAANKVLGSGDEGATKLVLAGLRSRMRSETGSPPALLNGRTAPAAGGPRPYESTAQMTADFNSKAYKTDPAFRAEVEKRVAASDF